MFDQADFELDDEETEAKKVDGTNQGKPDCRETFVESPCHFDQADFEVDEDHCPPLEVDVDSDVDDDDLLDFSD